MGKCELENLLELKVKNKKKEIKFRKWQMKPGGENGRETVRVEIASGKRIFLPIYKLILIFSNEKTDFYLIPF